MRAALALDAAGDEGRAMAEEGALLRPRGNARKRAAGDGKDERHEEEEEELVETNPAHGAETQLLAFLRVCIGTMHGAEHTEAQARRFHRVSGATELGRLVMRMVKAGGVPGGTAILAGRAALERLPQPASVAIKASPRMPASAAPPTARPSPAAAGGAAGDGAGGGSLPSAGSPRHRSMRVGGVSSALCAPASSAASPVRKCKGAAVGAASPCSPAKSPHANTVDASKLAARVAREAMLGGVFGSMELRATPKVDGGRTALAKRRLQEGAQEARARGEARAAAARANRAAMAARAQVAAEDAAVAEMAAEMAAEEWQRPWLNQEEQGGAPAVVAASAAPALCISLAAAPEPEALSSAPTSAEGSGGNG